MVNITITFSDGTYVECTSEHKFLDRDSMTWVMAKDITINQSLFDMKFNVDGMFSIDTVIYDKDRRSIGSVYDLSEGIKSVFVMSMLEAYIDEDGTVPSIIMIEDPEIFLHPQLQK